MRPPNRDPPRYCAQPTERFLPPETSTINEGGARESTTTATRDATTNSHQADQTSDYERNSAARPRRRLEDPTPLVECYPQLAVASSRRGRHAIASVQAELQGVRARRTRVLAHPDLAARLARTLRLTRASNWNGYVPPGTDSAGRVNTSPIRTALVEIATEAMRRERAAGGAGS